MSSYKFKYKSITELPDDKKLKSFVKIALQIREKYDSTSREDISSFFSRHDVLRLINEILGFVDKSQDSNPPSTFLKTIEEIDLAIAVGLNKLINSDLPDEKLRLKVNSHNYADRMLAEVIYAHNIQIDRADLLNDINKGNFKFKMNPEGQVYPKTTSKDFEESSSPQESPPPPPQLPSNPVVEKKKSLVTDKKLIRQNVTLVGVHYNNDPSLTQNYTDIITSNSPYLTRDDTLIIYNESFGTFNKKELSPPEGFGDIIKYRSIKGINTNRTENIKALVFGVPTDNGKTLVTSGTWEDPGKYFENLVNESLVAIVDAINNNPQIKYVLWSIRKTESSSSERIDDIDDQKKIELDLGLFNTEDRKGAKLVAKHITVKLFGLFDNRKYFFTGTIGAGEHEWVSDIFKNIFEFDPTNITSITLEVIQRLEQQRESNESELSILSKELNAKEEYIYNNKSDEIARLGNDSVIIQFLKKLKDALKKIIYVQTIKNEIDTFDLSITIETQEAFVKNISEIYNFTDFDKLKEQAKTDVNDLLESLKKSFDTLYAFLSELNSNSDVKSFGKYNIESNTEIESVCINSYNLLKMMSGFNGDIEGCSSFTTNIDNIDYNKEIKQLIRLNMNIHPDKNLKCTYYATAKAAVFNTILAKVKALKENNHDFSVNKQILTDCFKNNTENENSCNGDLTQDDIDSMAQEFVSSFFGNMSHVKNSRREKVRGQQGFDIFGNFFGNIFGNGNQRHGFDNFGSDFFKTGKGQDFGELVETSEPKEVRIKHGGKTVKAQEFILTYADGTTEEQIKYKGEILSSKISKRY